MPRVFSIFSLARLPPQTLVFLSSTLSFSLSPAQAPHSRPPALRRRVRLRAIPRPIRSGARGVMMASSADHSTNELSASKNVVDFTAVDFNSNDASCVPVQTAKVAPEAHFLAETCRCVIKQVSRRLKRLDWRRGAKELEARTEQGLRLRLRRRRRRRASKPLFFEPFFHALRHTLSFLYAAQGLPICPALLMDARERSHTAAACIKGGERTRTRASRRFSLAIVFSFQAVSIDSVLDSRELARRRKARVPAISHLISPRPPPTPFSSISPSLHHHPPQQLRPAAPHCPAPSAPSPSHGHHRPWERRLRRRRGRSRSRRAFLSVFALQRPCCDKEGKQGRRRRSFGCSIRGPRRYRCCCFRQQEEEAYALGERQRELQRQLEL